MSQQNISPSTLTEGVEQCRNFLSTLAPKEGSREIWIKQGHESIYKASWDAEGNLQGILTVCTTKDDPHSRIEKGRPIYDLLLHLSKRAEIDNGGVFYVPTQPQGLPIAECVTSTDDIGVEIDGLPYEEQIELFHQFSMVSSLYYSSLLTSGSVSVHAHIKVNFHALLNEMTYLRRLAQIAFTADPAMVRLHQPMRLPGFYRKEKQKMQELLSFCTEKYSPEAIKDGFRKWFEFREWVFPEEILDQWWDEVWSPMLRSSNPATHSAKLASTAKNLAEGQDKYIARRTAEKEQKRPIPSKKKGTLFEEIKRANSEASASAFSGVDWQGQSGHHRGQCPFHKGKTGNSAWLSDRTGEMKFHCSSCTDDNPRSAFDYFVAKQGLSSISGDHGLKGKDYMEAGKAFLTDLGYAIPREMPRIKNGNGHKPVDAGEFDPLIGSEALAATSSADIIEDTLNNLESKINAAQQKVEELTEQWEIAAPDKKKDLKERLSNANRILSTLISHRHHNRTQLNKANLRAKSTKAKSTSSQEIDNVIHLPNDKYNEAVELIISNLASESNYLETIYVQGNDFSEKWPVRVLKNPDNSVRIIDSLTADKVHVEMEKRFCFSKFDKEGNEFSASCPDRIAKSFLNEGEWLKLKPLDRISRIPLLQWDGTINNLSGYYLEEKTILDVKKDEFQFQENPTVEDARSSLNELKYFLREFHFKDLLGVKGKETAQSIDRSGAIAALLTAVSRHMYDLAPCFITNAHTPGSGKGTLASVITLIQDGRVQSERTWNPDPIELDKVIVSELLNQPSSLVIGNIDSKFGGSIIESLLTKTQYPGRVLGLSKMVYPSTKTLLMANGNNLTISKDMVRRTIMTRLDCGVEKPQSIEYEVKDIVGYTKIHRTRLFISALTILQAFLLSGETNTARSKLNGFEDWDKLVRGALLWMGEADPVQSQIALDEDDEEAVLLSRFIEVFISNFYAGKEVTPKQMIHRAEAKDPIDKGTEDYCETLREICYNFKSESFSKESLGKFLAKNQGQVKAGYCIRKLRRIEGGQPWTVEAPIQLDDRIEA
jgi:hypothetical protein